MPIKSVKMKISKNKKLRFFLMFQGPLNPKIRFLAQKLWSVVHVQRNTHTDRHTRKWILRASFQGFRIFFLQPIIKDRPNKQVIYSCYGNENLYLTLSSYRVFRKTWISWLCRRVFRKTFWQAIWSTLYALFVLLWCIKYVHWHIPSISIFNYLFYGTNYIKIQQELLMLEINILRGFIIGVLLYL